MAKGSDFMNNILKNRQKASGRKATGTDKIKDAVMNGGEKTKKSNGIMNTMKNMSKTFKNVANKVKNIASGITKLVNILISLFSSPVTWVIVALIFLYLLVQSGLNVLGQSDYAWNCNGQNDVALEAGAAGTTKYSFDEVRKFASAPISSTWGISDATAEKWYASQPNGKTYLSNFHISASDLSSVSKIFREQGVSPAFMYMYSVNEGGGAKGWINNGAHGQNGDALHDAKIDAGVVNEYSTKSGPIAKEDIPNLPIDAIQEWVNHMPKGSIGRVYPLMTSATGAEIGILMGKFHYPLGAKTYGLNLEQMMNDIKAMHGNTNDPQPFGKTDGGVGSMDGSTDNCSQQTGDTSSITSFAKSLVITNNISSANVSKDGNGWEQASAAYRQAYQKVGGPMSGTVGKLLASCDSFVATVMRNTVDKNFPWHATTQQQEYVKKNKHYKKIKCGDQQPGDFAFGEDSPGGPVQHIFIIANKQATEAYAASYHQHAAIDDKTSDYGSGGRKLGGCSGIYLHGADGHDYGEIWRYVG